MRAAAAVAVLVTVIAVTTAAPSAATTTRAASPTMYVGAAEDAAKAATLAEAKAKMDLAQLAGFNAVRLTAQWRTGQTEPASGELAGLKNAADAAALDGIEVFLSIYPYGSRVTPRTAQARDDFAAFATALATALPTVRHFIVGNEPNLNRFWLPQFDKGGRDVAATGYERLLAQTYDALKAVSPDSIVIGGSVAPRGADQPKSKRHTHSPTSFIRDLGRAYRASGRTEPIMDAFSMHPYEDNSSLPPTFAHPRSTTISLADYRKLVRLLAKAFDGTDQLGSGLPIVYDEFGVQSRIPARKEEFYLGRKPASARPVAEARQAAYYVQALSMAACQKTVAGFLIFHVSDEPDLDRWQSGLFYADDTPKASLRAVQDAIRDLGDGKIACGDSAKPAGGAKTRS
jgi:hypothetical protein